MSSMLRFASLPLLSLGLAAVFLAGPAALQAPAQTPAQPPMAVPTIGTFGFTAGETREQILAAIGKDALLKQVGDILEVVAAPKPNEGFDSYLLIVSPTQGLVKLIASGKDIDEDANGAVIRAKFTKLKTDLSAVYGPPSDSFDFLKSGSTLKRPKDFMMALTRNERTLSAYWTKKDFGNDIVSVELECDGLGDAKGYLSLEFEFSGYHDYLVKKK